MVLDDVLTLISNGGQGTKGSSLFIGRLPADPVNAVAVVQYGGSDAAWTMGAASVGSPAAEFPRFQVAVRNSAQSSAWNKALAIKALLNGYAGTTGGTTFLRIHLLGDLAELPEDTTDAFRVVASYEAVVAP